MRAVKEKPSVKERMALKQKAVPQAVFQRGAAASVQRLQKELREAAQDGQPEDRYESARIDDTADVAARKAVHLIGKSAHKQPKTKSRTQQDTRIETAGNSERSQAQQQTNHPVRKQASPSREKPVFERGQKSRVRESVQVHAEQVVAEKAVRKHEDPLRTEQHGERLDVKEKRNVSPKTIQRPCERPLPTATDFGMALPSIRTRGAVCEQKYFDASYRVGAAQRKELCQLSANEETRSRSVARKAAPTNSAHVQKQPRPDLAKKQAVKAAPSAKIKEGTSIVKAMSGRATEKAPVPPATVISKAQIFRETASKTARTAKESGKKILRAICAAAGRFAAVIGAGGAAAVCVVVVLLLVGMLFASPLGILFAGEDTGTQIRIPDAVAALNGEFTDAIYRIMEEYPCDRLDVQDGMEVAMLQNWRNVLAVYAVKVSTDDAHGMEVMTMDTEKLRLLQEVFFEANKPEYELTAESVDGERITTLHISVQIKDATQMADEYGFTAQRREMLEELLKRDYDDIFCALIGKYPPDGTPIGPVDISEIQGTLPDDLDPLRETVVLTAYQLLGKVTYFWGGKSLALGWDDRWGIPTTVTAEGSGATGKTLPFGLDCSGFVDWTFYNATGGSYLPGRGGGAATQHGYCENIPWSEAQPGDLVFYADDSHVGILCGFDAAGNVLVIHCSGGANGVVVTGKEGFAVAARPDCFAK